jgi:hypothetical protein
LVIVDSGHNSVTAYSDLWDFRRLAPPNKHLLLVDDIPTRSGATSGVQVVWEHWKHTGRVHELYHCFSREDREFSIGYYVHDGTE